MGTPDIRKRRKQADTRGVGKLPSSEGAAVDLQLLCLGEFQEAFSFPRQSSPGTALLSVLPFTRPAPQRLAPAQNAPGTRPAAASWVPVSRQPVPGQLAAQKRRQKTQPKTNTVHFASAPPCIPHSVLEVTKAGTEHQWQGPAARSSRGNACCGAIAVGMTPLLPGSTTLLPRGEEQNA